jgi:hypothetical protein
LPSHDDAIAVDTGDDDGSSCFDEIALGHDVHARAIDLSDSRWPKGRVRAPLVPGK